MEGGILKAGRPGVYTAYMTELGHHKQKSGRMDRRLLMLWLRSLWLRSRHDLAQSLLTIISGLTFGSVFIYIFSDFFASKLSSLGSHLTDAANLWFCYAASVLCFVLLVRGIRKENAPRSVAVVEAEDVTFSLWSTRYGAAPRDIGIYKALRALILTGFGVALSWLLCAVFFPTSGSVWTIFHLTAGCMAWAVGLSLTTEHGCTEVIKTSTWGKGRFMRRLFWPSAKRKMIFHVKWQSLWSGFRSIRHLLLLSLSLHPMAFFMGCLGFRWLEMLSLLWLSGLMASYAILTYEAGALRSATYEKLAGMSHRDYLSALWMVVVGLAGLYFLSALTFALGSVMLHQSMTAGLALKSSLIAALPILLVPCLIFQVDARRPLLNTLVVLLTSLFVGTAILVSILVMVLFPFAAVYSGKLCADRFYRA